MVKVGSKRTSDALAADEPPGLTCTVKPITEFTKTTIPVLTELKTSDGDIAWSIAFWYRPKKRRKKDKRTTYFVGTHQDALLEAEVFRVACEMNGGKDWQTQSKRNNGAIAAHYVAATEATRLFHQTNSSLSTSLHEPADRPLNCAEQKQFERLKKLMTRGEYVENFSSTAPQRRQEELDQRVKEALELYELEIVIKNKIEQERVALYHLELSFQGILKYIKERMKSLHSHSAVLDKEARGLLKALKEHDCKSFLIKQLLPEYNLNSQKLQDSPDAILDEGDHIYGYSEKQLIRIQNQVTACAHVAIRLKNRCDSEFNNLNDLLNSYDIIKNDGNLKIEDKHIKLAELISKYHKIKEMEHCSMPSIYEKVSREHFFGELKVHSLQKWWNQFKKYGAFFPDMRGKYERVHALEAINAVPTLVLFMQTTRLLTIDKTVDFLTEAFTSDERFKFNEQIKSFLPLTRSTVHN